jgi:hypothetical protein
MRDATLALGLPVSWIAFTSVMALDAHFGKQCAPPFEQGLSVVWPALV